MNKLIFYALLVVTHISHAKTKKTQPDDVFMDLMERSCLVKESRPIFKIEPHPEASGAKYLYFEKKGPKKFDRTLVTTEQVQRLGLKKGVMMCWSDSLSD